MPNVALYRVFLFAALDNPYLVEGFHENKLITTNLLQGPNAKSEPVPTKYHTIYSISL